MPRRGDTESPEGATPEQTLVRKIVMHAYRPKSAETSATELRLLARVTAEGRFSGVAQHVVWQVGSWMAQELHQFVRDAERQSGPRFLRLVVESQVETGVAWERILNRPSVPLMASEVEPDDTLPAAFQQARAALHAAAHAAANTPSPRPSLSAETRFDERWSLYVDALPASKGRADWYFTSRMEAEDRERFLRKVTQADPKLQTLILEDLTTHRRPAWERIRKQIRATLGSKPHV